VNGAKGEKVGRKDGGVGGRGAEEGRGRTSWGGVRRLEECERCEGCER